MATSPDVTPYVAPTLYDKDPGQLVARAILDAAVKFPDFMPYVGSPEIIWTQGAALVVAELIYAVHRVTGVTVEVLLRLFGIVRSEGTRPTATVDIVMADTLGYVLAAGTTFRLDLDDGSAPLLFATDAVVNVVAPADEALAVPVTATVATAAANGTPAGTVVATVAGDRAIDHVELASDVVGGAGPEDGGALLTRGAQTLRRLNSTLVVAADFEAYAAGRPDLTVFRVKALDNYDGTGGPPYSGDPGHVWVGVAQAGGAPLSAPNAETLRADMQARAHPALVVHVGAPTITNVAITAAVVRLPDRDPVEVAAAVVADLQAYLNPDTWPRDTSTVFRLELIARLDRSTGVDRPQSLTVPAADVDLPGPFPLATTDVDAADITVTDPA